MSHYHYSPLSPGPDRIRLLRLMPNKDETAPIQCGLFEYSLQELSKGTHLYEALSYVWGSGEKPQSVFIDDYYLPITVNLHAALLRLRDRSLERIIWIDPICINWENSQEQPQQLGLMAKIYSKANRVIVWLGEAADGSDEVIEEIRATASKKSTSSLNGETIQPKILALLQRPWFRRIWVREQSPDNIHKGY
jgi:hypothetical protein